MANKKLEVFVNLSKNLSVLSIDDKILKGSLVLEALNPFPAYYHELPTDTSSMYIYLVLDSQYPLERILRATQNISKEYDWDFDAGKAYLEIGSTCLDAIRVKHVPSLDMVEKIQEAYAKQGVKFLMNKKLQGKLEAYTKIVKFLKLEELADGVYLNAEDKTFAYVELPNYLNQEDFVKVSMDVKYNWDGSEFDAARASFYKDGVLSEMVRIRSDKIDLDYLNAIKKLYADKMK